MSRSYAALMAVASGLAVWNLDAQYHGTTGSPTTPRNSGFSRSCSSSGRSLYPRVDPAIITLVTGGAEWCLLGRKQEWPRGRYSTLAGFLEIGESLEQALAREVLEESGVDVQLPSVRYVASQPWPFPRSLMVGFYAAAAALDGSSSSSSSSSAGPVELLSHQGRMAMMDTGIKPAEVSAVLGDCRFLQPPVPQEGEMEDVRWFHRDWLSWALQQGPEAAPGGFMIPGEYSLAYRLITGWLQQQKQSVPQTVQNSHQESGSNSSSSSSSAKGIWLGDQVPQVEVDEGVFKYVLLRLTDSSSGRSKLLVRGAAAAAYHNHILQHTKGQLQKLCPQGTLQLDVLGGGRIEHHADQKVISVYGYSAAFGPAVHEVTAALLQRWYPFYDASSITWSYEGY
ncbi:hypothetical protein OEZ86_003125 [Tetradesmus obliquus]|nr:hypothetical protein OEZ86_003125 [Tetradesmus obliquus]